jgi:hypothetical protein
MWDMLGRRPEILLNKVHEESMCVIFMSMTVELVYLGLNPHSTDY